MKLKSFYGKKIHIIDNEGNEFVGTINDYIFPEDNENHKESIIVDLENGEAWEFYENDIKTIENAV